MFAFPPFLSLIYGPEKRFRTQRIVQFMALRSDLWLFLALKNDRWPCHYLSLILRSANVKRCGTQSIFHFMVFGNDLWLFMALKNYLWREKRFGVQSIFHFTALKNDLWPFIICPFYDCQLKSANTLIDLCRIDFSFHDSGKRFMVIDGSEKRFVALIICPFITLISKAQIPGYCSRPHGNSIIDEGYEIGRKLSEIDFNPQRAIICLFWQWAGHDERSVRQLCGTKSLGDVRRCTAREVAVAHPCALARSEKVHVWKAYCRAC